MAGLQPVAVSIPIPIRGEAYKIDREVVVVGAPVGASAVDFGMLRVVDDALRSLTVKNTGKFARTHMQHTQSLTPTRTRPHTGKYAIAFNFSMKAGSVLRDVLVVSPESGSVDPGKEAKVELSWNK
jgi:hydrocephalus-inducing protein